MDSHEEWLACVRSGAQDCVEPADPCVPKDCKYEGCSGGTWKYEYPPSEQPYDCYYYQNGYYQPPGQCNRDCCPPDAGDFQSASEYENYFSWWQWDCQDRYDDVVRQWCYCMDDHDAAPNDICQQPTAKRAGSYDPRYPLIRECGPLPTYTCDTTPKECRGPSTSGVGTYSSPSFPNVDDDTVREWGLLIVNATFSDDPDELIEVMVYDTWNDEPLLELPLVLQPNEPGTLTETLDLAGLIDPYDYQEIYLKATIVGHSGICLVDIAPDNDYFSGAATGLNNKDETIGFQKMPCDWGWGYPYCPPYGVQDENQTAFVHYDGHPGPQSGPEHA